MKVSTFKAMTTHDKEVFLYMRKNHKGRCAYNTARKCCGTCNDCPYDIDGNGFKTFPGGVSGSAKIYYDYEDAILARQEEYEWDW